MLLQQLSHEGLLLRLRLAEARKRHAQMRITAVFVSLSYFTLQSVSSFGRDVVECAIASLDLLIRLSLP